MAAVLACGEGAMLSHRSAAALWDIEREAAGQVDLTVLRRVETRRPGMRVRGRPSLRPSQVTSVDGIPLTGVVQTLVDLGAELSPTRLERAINNADKHDLIDPDALREALADHAGEPGVKALRRLLDEPTFRLSDSDLEILFRPIATAAGLPTPLTKQLVNGFEVDFYWPDLGLVIETDGLRYHRTPSTQTRDATRDRAHALAGMTALRFTHHEIRYEGSRVRDELSRIGLSLRRASDIDHT